MTYKSEMGHDKLTHEQKLQKVVAGEYVCQVPPVGHTHWTQVHWVQWIEKTGGWR